MPIKRALMLLSSYLQPITVSGLQYWTWKGASLQTTPQIPPQFISTFMDNCRAAFNYTFIDFPSLAVGEFPTLLPLLDVVLVVSSTCELALRSTKDILDQVTPEHRRRVRLIINRADNRDMIGRDDFEEALQFKAAAALPNQPQIAAGQSTWEPTCHHTATL